MLDYKAFKTSFRAVLWSPVRLHSSAEGAYVTPDREWEARASFFASSSSHVDAQCWQRGKLSFSVCPCPSLRRSVVLDGGWKSQPRPSHQPEAGVTGAVRLQTRWGLFGLHMCWRDLLVLRSLLLAQGTGRWRVPSSSPSGGQHRCCGELGSLLARCFTAKRRFSFKGDNNNLQHFNNFS